MIKKFIQESVFRLLRRLDRGLQVVRSERKRSDQRRLIRRLSEFGEGSRLNGDVTIVQPENCVIGANVHVGTGAYINSMGTVIIGDNTHISRDVLIYSYNHNMHNRLPYDSGRVVKPVVIGRNVWVGARATIAPGTIVGDGAVIGMGAVVSGNVEECAIVASPKAVPIGWRDRVDYQRLASGKRLGGVDGRELDAEPAHKSLRDLAGNAFFIVGTGRSGTNSLAEILSKVSGVTCTHERLSTLWSLGWHWMHEPKTRDRLTVQLKQICESLSVFQGEHFGESHQRIACLIEPLAAILPEAKFLGLIRNGKACVASMVGRGWYSDQETRLQGKCLSSDLDIWQNTRIRGDFSGQMSTEEWSELGAFGRCCWYWGYWNALMNSQLACIPNRCILVRLEDLDAQLQAIASFLGVDGAKLQNIVCNVATHPRHDVSAWSRNETLLFNRFCGSLQNKYYPEDPAD